MPADGVTSALTLRSTPNTSLPIPDTPACPRLEGAIPSGRT
jgi:hypothetical protein